MRISSPILSRTVFVCVLAGWALVAILMGLMAIFEWPAKVGLSSRWGLVLGVALVGVGQFMSAMVADLLFPSAHRGVTGAMEIAPWLAVAAVVVGGILWPII